jgi:hypothetical protein
LLHLLQLCRHAQAHPSLLLLLLLLHRLQQLCQLAVLPPLLLLLLTERCLLLGAVGYRWQQAELQATQQQEKEGQMQHSARITSVIVV